MARQAKEEERAPCFGHYDPDMETCDPEVCADLADCKETTGVGEDEPVEVDLNTMDMAGLVEFAEEQNIEFNFDLDEAEEEDVRTAIFEAMSQEGEEPEAEEPEAEEPEAEEPEAEEPEAEEPEAEEPEAEEPPPAEAKKAADPKDARKSMTRKAPPRGATIERLPDNIVPVALKPFKEALKKIGELREKKSIINVIIGGTQFMGVARRDSTAEKIACIVYGSGKWPLPKDIEKSIERWTDKRHNNEIKLVVHSDKIDGAVKLIERLVKIGKNQVASKPTPKAKAPEAKVKQPEKKVAKKVVKKVVKK